MKVSLYNGSTCNHQDVTFAYRAIWAPVKDHPGDPLDSRPSRITDSLIPSGPKNPCSNLSRRQETRKEPPLHFTWSVFLGCQDSKKICISTKGSSTESPSRKESECNLGKKKKKECHLSLQITVGNFQKLADATISVLHVKSARSLQPWTVKCFSSFHRTQTLSLLADWHFLAYKATCPCGQVPSFHPAATPNSWLSRF